MLNIGREVTPGHELSSWASDPDQAFISSEMDSSLGRRFMDQDDLAKS